MRIGIIGGLSRSGQKYERLAQSSGHEVEFHSGETGGHGAAEIVALIERIDLLVVTTDINSHGAVRLAPSPGPAPPAVGPARQALWHRALPRALAEA